jgi:hypothetical protein
MRKALYVILLLATTSCGGGGREASVTRTEDLQTFDVEESAPVDRAVAPPPPPAAPGISPTAAPGVAFNYRYAFRLPAARIAAVQEQHALACEKLGLDRCRITGMRYRLVNDRDIEALLALKLDPAIARNFGKQGIDAVVRAEGMLVDSEITGEDVGTQIAAGGRSIAELEEDLRTVEAQLARSGLKSPERAELQAQAQRLRESIRAIRASQSDKRESLARTPMVFHYGSGDLAPGFDTRPRVREAVEEALDNFLGALAWIFVALVTLLPWALLIAIGAWLAMRGRRLFDGRGAAKPAANSLEE